MHPQRARAATAPSRKTGPRQGWWRLAHPANLAACKTWSTVGARTDSTFCTRALIATFRCDASARCGASPMSGASLPATQEEHKTRGEKGGAGSSAGIGSWPTGLGRSSGRVAVSAARSVSRGWCANDNARRTSACSVPLVLRCDERRRVRQQGKLWRALLKPHNATL
jgi:hypothetical protein